jgi:hypothetical protein
MADLNLTQEEADRLIAMEKHAANANENLLFPGPGERLAIPLSSADKRENFMLDITRAQIKLTKATPKSSTGSHHPHASRPRRAATPKP